MGVISLFLTKSGQVQLLLVQLKPWALPDAFLGKISPNTETGLTQNAVSLNWLKAYSVSMAQYGRSNDLCRAREATREVVCRLWTLHWSTKKTTTTKNQRPRAVRFLIANTDKQPTCLCSHRKRRLAAACTVTRHDVERVLGVRAERFDFGRRGEHRVLSEKAVVIRDSYEVMSGPALQAESHHQSCAVLWLHFFDGIHHLGG